MLNCAPSVNLNSFLVSTFSNSVIFYCASISLKLKFFLPFCDLVVRIFFNIKMNALIYSEFIQWFIAPQYFYCLILHHRSSLHNYCIIQVKQLLNKASKFSHFQIFCNLYSLNLRSKFLKLNLHLSGIIWLPSLLITLSFFQSQ